VVVPDPACDVFVPSDSHGHVALDGVVLLFLRLGLQSLSETRPDDQDVAGPEGGPLALSNSLEVGQADFMSLERGV
jgi:hypothetical protein